MEKRWTKRRFQGKWNMPDKIHERWVGKFSNCFKMNGIVTSGFLGDGRENFRMVLRLTGSSLRVFGVMGEKIFDCFKRKTEQAELESIGPSRPSLCRNDFAGLGVFQSHSRFRGGEHPDIGQTGGGGRKIVR